LLHNIVRAHRPASDLDPTITRGIIFFS